MAHTSFERYVADIRVRSARYPNGRSEVVLEVGDRNVRVCMTPQEARAAAYQLLAAADELEPTETPEHEQAPTAATAGA